MFMVFVNTENKIKIKKIKSNFDYLEDCGACPIEKGECTEIANCISSTRYDLVKKRKRRF